MSKFIFLQTLPQKLIQPTAIATAASIGLHSILAINLPTLSANSSQNDKEKQGKVKVVQLNPEEQSRIPALSQLPVPSSPSQTLPPISSANPPVYPNTSSSENTTASTYRYPTNYRYPTEYRYPTNYRYPTGRTYAPRNSGQSQQPSNQPGLNTTKLPGAIAKQPASQSNATNFTQANKYAFYQGSQKPPTNNNNQPPTNNNNNQPPTNNNNNQPPTNNSNNNQPPTNNNNQPPTNNNNQPPTNNNNQPPTNNNNQPPTNNNNQPQQPPLTARQQQLREGLAYNADGTSYNNYASKSADWYKTNASGVEEKDLKPKEEKISASYPQDACFKEISNATAFVGVVVDANGNIKGEPEILRSSGYALFNQEAINAVKSHKFAAKGKQLIYSVEVKFQDRSKVCPSRSVS